MYGEELWHAAELRVTQAQPARKAVKRVCLRRGSSAGCGPALAS
ncbi:hypothetical protein CNECB9_2550037 [Cupriavidus necator]|uniref:Uncharacterized protein n=1 Tax=Cupriavidus necator TaxID=106590 RepID=A0A1K0IEY8_CUPNE|nr:hypothetical protein CNECB9_2550037 [Cupriavidus necator]